MTDQPGSEPGNEYEALFRPEPPAPTPASAEVKPTHIDRAETGRVFKSQGVQGNEQALLALPTSRISKLRTLERVDTPITDEQAIRIGRVSQHESAVPTDAPQGERTRSQGRGAVFGSLSALWIYGITIGATLIFGLLDVLIFGGEPGAFSGLGLLAVSIFISLAVRSQDDSQAIYAPAIAFFVMAITVGQINVTDTSLINRFVSVFFILGNNWFWVIGSTIMALGIVAFRRRSLRYIQHALHQTILLGLLGCRRFNVSSQFRW